MERFCTEHDVPFEQCGKVIVAVDERELPRLHQLEERAVANGVHAERVGHERLRELEPHVAGIAALHVAETGVVDYSRVAHALAAEIAVAGAEVRLGHRAIAVDERADAITVGTDRGRHPRTRARELRRVAVGPGGGGRRRAPRPADRAVPRRVPRAGAERGRARAPPDLPRARPRPAVPRRAPVAWGRRGRPRGPERGARTPARGVLVELGGGSGAAPARDVPGVLAHGAPVLAGRRGRGLPLAQQARARPRAGAPRTRHHRHRSPAVPRGRARAGGRARRHTARRLRAARDRACGPRVERAVTRGDGVARHRRVDRHASLERL